MQKWVKTALFVLVISFALFYLFTQPEAAADAVKTFFGAFGSIFSFFTSLAS